MRRSFRAWLFYHNMYDYSQYNAEQLKQKHVEMIVKELLLKRFRYSLLKELSTEGWWVLQKP